MQQYVARQVNANKYHFAPAHFFGRPLRPQVAAHQLVHALENHFAVGALHVQHALVAQHARAVDIDDGPQEIFELDRIECPIGLEHKTLDVVIVVMVVGMPMRRVVAGFTVFMIMIVIVIVIVMVVMLCVLQEIRIDIELGVQVESAQVQHIPQGHFTKVHRLLRRTGVHVLQTVLQVGQLIGRDQVCLADEDLVGKTHLAARFLAGIELLVGMLGVNRVMMESSR